MGALPRLVERRRVHFIRPVSDTAFARGYWCFSLRLRLLSSRSERQYQAHIHQGRSLADFSNYGGVRGFLRSTFASRSRGDGVWLCRNEAERSLLRGGGGFGACFGETQVGHHPRRGRRHHGRGQQRRSTGQGKGGGVEYPIAARAEGESVREHSHAFSVLLFAQGVLREV